MNAIAQTDPDDGDEENKGILGGFDSARRQTADDSAATSVEMCQLRPKREESEKNEEGEKMVQEGKS